MKYALDASVAVECLLRTPLGIKVADIITEAELVAPDLLDLEILSVLRRISFRLQGAESGAYSLYVTLSATQNTGRKTSKMCKLFLLAS